MSSNVLQPNPPHITPFSLLFFFSLSLSLSLKTCLPQIPFCKYPLSSSLSSQKTTYFFFFFHRSYVGFLGVFLYCLLFVSVRVSHRENRKARTFSLSPSLLSLSLSFYYYFFLLCPSLFLSLFLLFFFFISLSPLLCSLC